MDFAPDTYAIIGTILAVGFALAGMGWRMASRLDKRIGEDRAAAEADRRAQGPRQTPTGAPPTGAPRRPPQTPTGGNGRRPWTPSGRKCCALPNGSPISKAGSKPPNNRRPAPGTRAGFRPSESSR